LWGRVNQERWGGAEDEEEDEEEDEARG